jgi:hypothetical protein
MAQEDLQQYFAYHKEVQPVLETLHGIYSQKDTAHHLMNGVIEEAGNAISQIQKKLLDLRNYSLCEHQQTKEVAEGHDSHKDYYSKVCVNCGKTLEEWSV